MDAVWVPGPCHQGLGAMTRPLLDAVWVPGRCHRGLGARNSALMEPYVCQHVHVSVQPNPPIWPELLGLGPIADFRHLVCHGEPAGGGPLLPGLDSPGSRCCNVPALVAPLAAAAPAAAEAKATATTNVAQPACARSFASGGCGT
jgi:hypothetical protein